jgi:uncharacterized protein
MLGGWSSTIDPIQLADKGAHLSGELPLKGMSRLLDMCRDDDGSVSVDLHFERGSADGLRGEREDLLESGDALVVERAIALGELVEDELLLELPMVPMHAGSECPAGDSASGRTARRNPFAVLEKLKHTDR